MNFPSSDEWQALVRAGFRSNGASNVPDTLWGLRIANGDERYPPLPADWHDALYYLGGSEEDRLQADLAFRDAMIALVERGWSWLRPLRRKRAELYFIGVRVLGESHFSRPWTEKA